jgi:hypothetical protein
MEVLTSSVIEQLPLWAQVAFAARCARLVFHLYVAWAKTTSKASTAAVSNAIEYAEGAASTAPDDADPENWSSPIADGARAASETAKAAANAQVDRYPLGEDTLFGNAIAADSITFNEFSGASLASYAAAAAYEAASAAAAAAAAQASEARGGSPMIANLSARLAASHAYENARTAVGIRSKVAAAMVDDFKLLQTSVEKNNWSKLTPIPGGFFPPP